MTTIKFGADEDTCADDLQRSRWRQVASLTLSRVPIINEKGKSAHGYLPRKD
jgi:hypothetical protein